jgi:hypothetical protein
MDHVCVCNMDTVPKRSMAGVSPVAMSVKRSKVADAKRERRDG